MNIQVDFAETVPVVAAVVVVWWSCATAAAICAPPGRAVQFAVISLLFLGPLGVGFAAAAAPRDRGAPHGRHSIHCPRCDARQHVLDDDDTFECWRCLDRYRIEKGPFGRRFEVGRISAGSWSRLASPPGPAATPDLADTSWRLRGDWDERALS